MADTWQWLNGVVMGHNAGHADCFDCKCLLYFACQLSLVSPVSGLILAINIPFHNSSDVFRVLRDVSYTSGRAPIADVNHTDRLQLLPFNSSQVSHVRSSV